MSFKDFYEKFASFLPSTPLSLLERVIQYIHQRQTARLASATAPHGPRPQLLLLAVDEVAKHPEHKDIIHELSELQDGLQNRLGLAVCLIFTTLASVPMRTAASQSNRAISVRSELPCLRAR
jgi:hypothetical protein